MTDTSKREDDGRIRIWVNSGANMSRGKYAAAAVHAALTAAGVHPGTPVIVLGGQRDQIEHMRTVIHDAGRTEVEPGTATAGTDYVFEQAHTPTDDEREVRRAAEERYPTIRPHDHEPTHPKSALRHYMQGAFISGWNASRASRRTAVQEPSDDDEVLKDLVIRLNNEAYGKPDFTWGQVQRQIQGVEMARAALRAAAGIGQEEKR